jgi:hypothetical protein
MKFILCIALLYSFCGINNARAQSALTDKKSFFNDTAVINATIITNMNKLLKHDKKALLPANFITILSDGTSINDSIQLEARGNMRNGYCYMPPLKIIFNHQQTATLASLKSLKLVNECKIDDEYDQYLLKEFIIYKIYNLLTDMSFRVRFINVTFKDSAGKKKSITEHAFLVEDIKQLAKRNECKESKMKNLGAQFTDRRQMAIVDIFQYMIGNTDWAVSANHNIKFIERSIEAEKKIFVVPYDFDYSGLVNTEYAIPSENIGTGNVRERVYRGYKKTMDELNDVLSIFKNKKDEIYGLISNFNLLKPASKKYMIGYLDDFYKQINKPADIKFYFIDNARVQ